MMKKVLSILAACALPAVLATGCGGEDIFGDGGSTVYKIVTGTYNTTAATVTADTCMDGVTGAILMSKMRSVTNDPTGGTISIASADGQTLLCQGAVRFNMNQGAFTYGPVSIMMVPCNYTTNRQCSIKVTANNQFDLSFTDTRTNPMSSGGMTCNQPATCQVSFNITLKM